MARGSPVARWLPAPAPPANGSASRRAALVRTLSARGQADLPCRVVVNPVLRHGLRGSWRLSAGLAAGDSWIIAGLVHCREKTLKELQLIAVQGRVADHRWLEKD